MAWFDINYAYKKKITIDHTLVGADEVDFPVLISVTDNDLRDDLNGGHVESASGYDIIFTNSIETVQLKHEIEKYTDTNGLLVYWVKVPALSSTVDTDIYIYYGKAGVVVDPSTTDTWDANFMAVWHMNSLLDSTSNNIDLTNGGATGGQVGKIGDCYDFEATAGPDSLYHPTFLDGAFDTLSMSCWVKQESNINSTFIAKENTAGIDRFYFRRDTGALNLFVEAGNSGTKMASVGAIGLATWYYCCGKYDKATQLRVILDVASAVGNVQANTFGAGTSDHFYIGRFSAAATNPMDGLIDEVRISSTVRDTNWEATSYRSQNDPAGFMSWGAEEEQGADVSAGIKVWDGTADIELVKDDASPVKIETPGGTIGVELVDTADGDASAIRFFDGVATKAFKKKT